MQEKKQFIRDQTGDYSAPHYQRYAEFGIALIMGVLIKMNNCA